MGGCERGCRHFFLKLNARCIVTKLKVLSCFVLDVETQTDRVVYETIILSVCVYLRATPGRTAHSPRIMRPHLHIV